MRNAHEDKMRAHAIKERELGIKEAALASDIEFKGEAQDLAEDKVALDEAFRRDQLAQQ